MNIKQSINYGLCNEIVEVVRLGSLTVWEVTKGLLFMSGFAYFLIGVPVTVLYLIRPVYVAFVLTVMYLILFFGIMERVKLKREGALQDSFTGSKLLGRKVSYECCSTYIVAVSEDGIGGLAIAVSMEHIEGYGTKAPLHTLHAKGIVFLDGCGDVNQYSWVHRKEVVFEK